MVGGGIHIDAARRSRCADLKAKNFAEALREASESLVYAKASSPTGRAVRCLEERTYWCIRQSRYLTLLCHCRSGSGVHGLGRWYGSVDRSRVLMS